MSIVGLHIAKKNVNTFKTKRFDVNDRKKRRTEEETMESSKGNQENDVHDLTVTPTFLVSNRLRGTLSHRP